MIGRRDFLRAGLAVGAASVISGRLSIGQGPRNIPIKSRPNIIFIFADDWGYGDLGVHGSSFCKTPNLDRMAEEGVMFQTAWASALCSARASAGVTCPPVPPPATTQ